jgi:hypothetical protein
MTVAYHVLVDPASAPIGAAVQVVRLAWGGYVSGRDLKRASEAIGKVVPDALAKALCPGAPGGTDVNETVTRIAARLQELPIEEEEPKPGVGKRFRRQARSIVPRRLRPNRVPPIRRFAKKQLDDLLREWLERAFQDEDVSAAVARIRCRGESPEVSEVLGAFPDCFFFALLDADEGDWRDRLLSALKEQREATTYLEEERQRRGRRRGFAITLTTGAATGAAGGAIAGGSPEIIALTTLLGLALGAAGGVVEGETQRRPTLTRAQVAARDSVRAWLTDLAKTIRHLGDPPGSGSPNDAKSGESASSLGDAIQEWGQGGDRIPVTATFSDELLADLSGRLKQNAQQSSDDELLGDLIALETAVVRCQRDDEDQQAVIDALQAVLATVVLTPDPEIIDAAGTKHPAERRPNSSSEYR